jgi:hypothetical protein
MDVTTNISSAPTCNNKYKVAHDLFAWQENWYAKCPLLTADDNKLKNNEADLSSENLTSTTTE